MRVLIVDDSESMRTLLRVLLRRDPRFSIAAEAADGAEAIEAAKEHQPDLVLLDIRMPGMDGLEALPRLREVAPDARIVMVSGLDPDVYGKQARELGADGFIEKGGPPAEFQAQLWALAGEQPKA